MITCTFVGFKLYTKVFTKSANFFIRTYKVTSEIKKKDIVASNTAIKKSFNIKNSPINFFSKNIAEKKTKDVAKLVINKEFSYKPALKKNTEKQFVGETQGKKSKQNARKTTYQNYLKKLYQNNSKLNTRWYMGVRYFTRFKKQTMLMPYIKKSYLLEYTSARNRKKELHTLFSLRNTALQSIKKIKKHAALIYANKNLLFKTTKKQYLKKSAFNDWKKSPVKIWPEKLPVRGDELIEKSFLNLQKVQLLKNFSTTPYAQKTLKIGIRNKKMSILKRRRLEKLKLVVRSLYILKKKILCKIPQKRFRLKPGVEFSRRKISPWKNTPQATLKNMKLDFGIIDLEMKELIK